MEQHWFGEGQYKVVLRFSTGSLKIRLSVDPRSWGASEWKDLAKQYLLDFRELQSIMMY